MWHREFGSPLKGSYTDCILPIVTRKTKGYSVKKLDELDSRDSSGALWSVLIFVERLEIVRHHSGAFYCWKIWWRHWRFSRTSIFQSAHSKAEGAAASLWVTLHTPPASKLVGHYSGFPFPLPVLCLCVEGNHGLLSSGKIVFGFTWLRCRSYVGTDIHRGKGGN